MSVTVYTEGLVNVSVCAPGDMPVHKVEAEVNRTHPTGIESRWSVTEPQFSGGQANGCVCDQDPSRRHWLLCC